MKQVVNLPRQMRGAEVRSASFDESDNTIEVVWTTGASVRRRSWAEGPYNEELIVDEKSVRLDRLNLGAPFLDSHSDWSLRDVIGSVVPGSARLKDGVGTARIQLSRAAGHADIVQNIRDGIIRNVSVGYAIHRVDKIAAKREGDIPTWRVVDWEPHEISAVPVPADAAAQIRSAPTVECVIESNCNPAAAALARMRMSEAELAR